MSGGSIWKCAHARAHAHPRLCAVDAPRPCNGTCKRHLALHTFTTHTLAHVALQVDLSLVHNVVPSFSSEGSLHLTGVSIHCGVSRRKANYVLRFSMLPVLFDRGQGVCFLNFLFQLFAFARSTRGQSNRRLRDRVASQLSGFVIGVRFL